MGLQIPLGMDDEISIRDTDWRCRSQVSGAVQYMKGKSLHKLLSGYGLEEALLGPPSIRKMLLGLQQRGCDG